MDRDCENCVRNKPGCGCTSWDCDFIDRKEAIKAYLEKRERENNSVNNS